MYGVRGSNIYEYNQKGACLKVWSKSIMDNRREARERIHAGNNRCEGIVGRVKRVHR